MLDIKNRKEIEYERQHTNAVRVQPSAAAQRADELGQLAPGMFADITVLSPNPFKLAPDDLQQAKVQATYVAGKKVYER